MKMFHPFKALIAATSVVGLEINRRSIGLVAVSHTSGDPEIERLALKQVKDPDQLGTELQDFVRTEALLPEMLITSLPTSVASIRELHFPFANPQKIREVIKYQMEPLVPYNVEDMVVELLPPRNGEPITAIGVEKRALADHLKTLDQAELAPDKVALHDLALFSLFLKTRKQKTDKPVALIRLGEEEVAFQVIREGRLDFLRVLPCKEDIVDTVKESFHLYTLKNPPSLDQNLDQNSDQDTPRHALGEAYVTGPLASQEGILDGIGKVLGIKVSLWRPFEGIKHKSGNIEDALQAMLSVPLALALSAGNGPEESFDLLREEFAPKTAGNIKGPLIYLFSALILFLGLWTFHVYQKLDVQENNYRQLKGAISRVFTETFPDAHQMVKGRELEQMRQRIGEEKGKYRWLNQVTAQGLVLETLLGVTKVVSGLADVKIDNISIDGSALHLDGHTSSFKAVDDLKGNLSGVGSFSSVKLVGAKMDNRQGAVMFSFALEKKP